MALEKVIRLKMKSQIDNEQKSYYKYESFSNSWEIICVQTVFIPVATMRSKVDIFTYMNCNLLIV